MEEALMLLATITTNKQVMTFNTNHLETPNQGHNTLRPE